MTALDSVSFDLKPGEALGILGESGCGKSSLAHAISGLLPKAGRIARGSVSFRGQRLDSLDERGLEKVRGAEIALVLQDPTLALHPLHRAGEQIVEVIRAHHPWRRERCRARARRLLTEVGFDPDDGIYEAYPHQLSGGQRQRIVIAQALACEPTLLLADEPTAALDVTTQAHILGLLRDLRHRFEIALIFISHDPQVLAEVADRVLVMYAGQVIEQGPVDRVFRQPLHPYTAALLRCIPPLPVPYRELTERELPTIPGAAPAPGSRPPACRFAPRCARRMPICTQQPPAGLAPRPAHVARCFLDENNTLSEADAAPTPGH